MLAQPEIKKESNNLFFDSLPTEAVDSAEEEEESEVDITKVSPIMKYMAGKLVEQKYNLEMAGPFAYRSDIPGLSKHLFVAYKMVTMLEEAGYTGSKMYMSAMFPAGLKDTKTELIGLVNKGKLHQGIKGSKLTKLCVRCIRCFLAYYTGKSDDIDTSDGECSDSNDEVEEEEEGINKPNKTVTTSMMDVLQRVKEEENQPGENNEVAASVGGGRFSGEDNPWQTMELGMRSEKLRSFTALQSHFTKQLVGKGVDQRDAREQASDSMMCLVVADFNDASLRNSIIKDMYRLEFHLATNLNVRAEKRRLTTVGVFCPRTTAELGDRPGLVSARMVRLLASVGFSNHSLRNQIMEARDRGSSLTLPLAKMIGTLSKPEDRVKCEAQIQIVKKYIEDYFLRRGE